jgi:hypothetical protein
MAAHVKYPPAHEQLFVLAVRARRAGLSFEVFWADAVRPGQAPVTVATRNPPAGAVQWPRDTNDRNVAIGATIACEEGWRRAYEGMAPTGPERALLLLAPILGAVIAASTDLEPVAA